MASEEERNSRLDALATAVRQYASSQRKILQKQVETSKRILQGRTGSDRMANSSVQAASNLVVDELDDFLGD